MHAENDADSVSTALVARIGEAIDAAGGWLPFSAFMAMALYEPGLGYYASGRIVVGRMPEGGSDFVTAPEISPLFGRALARQVEEALAASGGDEVWEFGAGSGALAAELLAALGPRIRRYSIVELSAPLRERQRQATREFGATVRWLDALPEGMIGVVIGNEVLDAMPVDLLHFDGMAWCERGVVRGEGERPFVFVDLPTTIAPPDTTALPAGTTTETHAQAEAFVSTLAERMDRGAAFFVDYGFPESEYYHPQRSQGTLMCHREHRADPDVLADVGVKDITAHVDFPGVALAGQDAGFEVAGYTSQARFLLNCGVAELMERASLRARAEAAMLLNEHEMGELFKVIAFTKGLPDYAPLGFASGDRRHRL
ncbi:MAG: SAM-dependent methyltransferase [Caldimonas sp.]